MAMQSCIFVVPCKPTTRTPRQVFASLRDILRIANEAECADFADAEHDPSCSKSRLPEMAVA